MLLRPPSFRVAQFNFRMQDKAKKYSRFSSKSEDKFLGFILLHRRIKEHWVWDDPVKLKWWLDLLITVNHTGKKVSIGNLIIECKRGQTIRSVGTWAREWRVDESKVRRFFKMLQSDGMIVTESVSKSTRITVCNYDSYNGTRRDNDEMMTTSRRDNDEQVTTNNNENNENNEKNNEKERELPLPLFFSKEDKEHQVARLWSCLQTDCPDFIDVKKFPKCIAKKDVEKLVLDFPGMDGFSAVKAVSYKLYGHGLDKKNSVPHKLRVWLKDERDESIVEKLSRAREASSIIKRYQNDPDYRKYIDENGGVYPSSRQNSAYLEQRRKDEAQLARRLAAQ